MPAGGKKYTPRSKLYEQTASKTSGPPLVSTRYQDGTGDAEFTKQITQAEYDRVVNQIYLSEENVELLETVKLLGEVTNRRSSSGPMSGTAKIVASSISTSGDTTIPFTPGDGEVWEFQGVDAERAGSGQILYQLYLVDSTNGTEVYFYYMKSSDSNVLFFSDADSNYFNSPIYFDENVTLKCRATDSGGTLTSVTFSVAVIRIR